MERVGGSEKEGDRMRERGGGGGVKKKKRRKKERLEEREDGMKSDGCVCVEERISVRENVS